MKKFKLYQDNGIHGLTDLGIYQGHTKMEAVNKYEEKTGPMTAKNKKNIYRASIRVD